LQTKKCSKCGKIKSIDEFYKREGNRDGYNGKCKTCIIEYDKIRYRNNYEEMNQRNAEWRINNPEKYKEYNKKYREVNREKIREYSEKRYKNNPEVREYRAKWQKDNPDNTRSSKKRYNQSEKGKKRNREIAIKWREINRNRLSNNISRIMRASLNKGKEGRHWEELVSYSLKELIKYFEKLFKRDMTWGNYGKWHIDHIIPVSLWKFESYNDREFKQCWALCNLQPLWAFENRSKGNKI